MDPAGTALKTLQATRHPRRFSTGAMILLQVLAAGSGLAAAVADPTAAPENLRVEGLQQEVAVLAEPTPRFSFVHGQAAAGGNFGTHRDASSSPPPCPIPLV